MFNDDDICFTAVLQLRFDNPKGLFRQWGGGYVNAWTFAPNEESARRNFIAESPNATGGTVVAINGFGPANPDEIQTTSGIDITDVPDGEESKHLRSLTRDELQTAFSKSTVVFATIYVWKRKPWWHFWRREKD